MEAGGDVQASQPSPASGGLTAARGGSWTPASRAEAAGQPASCGHWCSSESSSTQPCDPLVGSLQDGGGSLQDGGARETQHWAPGSGPLGCWVGFGMEGGRGWTSKITEGAGPVVGQGGLSVGGPLMGNGLPGRRGRASLRSGLGRCGTSGRARGLPGGNSHCRRPRWTVPFRSPGWEQNAPVGKAPLPPPRPLGGTRKTKCSLAQSWCPHHLCPTPSYTHPSRPHSLSSPTPAVPAWAVDRAVPTPIKDMRPVPLVSTPF